MILNNQENEKCYSLIVNYLPQSIKENDLSQIFSSIGPLKSCKLMQDKQTGISS
jgi:RNA recognition motif-containing protein